MGQILAKNGQVCKQEPKTKADIKKWHVTRQGLDQDLGALMAKLEAGLFGCWRGLLEVSTLLPAGTPSPLSPPPNTRVPFRSHPFPN